ncbi:MAG: hypothetical protein AAF823_14080 [Planctomycetota bacterium]
MAELTRATLAEAVARVERHNANVAVIDRMWCRMGVRVMWVEGDKQRRESGEGVLMVRRPGEVALSVGKLGQDGLWAGGDGERVWLFDLREGVAWVGAADPVSGVGTGLPLGIEPGEVPRLLGWSAIDVADVRRGRVTAIGDRLWIEPRDAQGRATARYVFDPAVEHPVRIDLLEPDGGSAVTSRLSDAERVTYVGRGVAEIGADVAIALSDGSSELILRLRDYEPAGERIRDAAFDFERLVRAHRPEEIVEIDRR